jgi:hypothetical protein
VGTPSVGRTSDGDPDGGASLWPGGGGGGPGYVGKGSSDDVGFGTWDSGVCELGAGPVAVKVSTVLVPLG